MKNLDYPLKIPRRAFHYRNLFQIFFFTFLIYAHKLLSAAVTHRDLRSGRIWIDFLKGSFLFQIIVVYICEKILMSHRVGAVLV